MSILDLVEKPQNRPIIATICGDAGLGKTSLAATFPKPIFIRAEDGLQAIPEADRPDAFPKIHQSDELWQQLKGLATEQHDYKTVVIDSVTQLETLFGDYVIANDKKNPKSLAQANGGFGAGYAAVAQMHQRVRKAAEVLNERGMNVIFIAHVDTTTIELPDQDPFTRYDLRLHKKSMTHYVDNVDLVAHVRLQTFVHGEDGERKKAISDGTRVIYCHTAAACVAKNRYGITQEIPFVQGQNPFQGVLPI